MQKIQPEKFLIKIYLKNGKVQRTQTKVKRRISLILQRAKNSEVNKFYISVTYSPIVNSSNEIIKPKNEAYCLNKEMALYLLSCFTEA